MYGYFFTKNQLLISQDIENKNTVAFSKAILKIMHKISILDHRKSKR